MGSLSRLAAQPWVASGSGLSMGLASALSGPAAALLLAVAVSIVGVVNLVDLARRPPPPARGARATMWSRIRRCGLWPLLPILAWNLAFAGRLPPLFADDRAIPALILGVEMVGRVVVFGPVVGAGVEVIVGLAEVDLGLLGELAAAGDRADGLGHRPAARRGGCPGGQAQRERGGEGEG